MDSIVVGALASKEINRSKEAEDARAPACLLTKSPLMSLLSSWRTSRVQHACDELVQLSFPRP